MRMLGKTNHPPCGSRCCGYKGVRHTRLAKRRERAAWRKVIRNG